MRLFIFLNLIIFFIITYSKNIHDYQNSNDILNEDLLLKTTTKISLASMKCTESRRCGCYKDKCWAYIDDKQRPTTGWWCFTQREGIRTRQRAWAKCTDSDQCSWTMSCGDCYTYVGIGNRIKTNKLIC